MIEINLLPQELRSHSRKEPAIAKLGNLPKQRLIFGLILGLAAFMISLHLVIGLLGFMRNFYVGALQKKWLALEPERKELEVLKKEYPLLFPDEGTRQLLQKRVIWAGKLNKLSDLLPNGMWFNSLSVDAKGFSLGATVISFSKEEMNLINRFIGALKADKEFSEDFQGISLGQIERRNIGGYDVVDFSLSAELSR
jgi:Tfp pilus assembly protein PilN